FAGRGIAVGGDDDGRNSDTSTLQALEKLQAGHLGHLQVDDQALRQLIGQRRQKLLRRTVRPGRKRAHAQRPSQGLQHRRVVIHDSDPTGLRHEERLSGRQRRLSTWPLGQYGRSADVAYFETPAFSAMRTRSATARTPSFLMMELRWTLM